jgi:hypothetical protein
MNKIIIQRPCKQCVNGIIRHSDNAFDWSWCDCDDGYIFTEYAGFSDEQIEILSRILTTIEKENNK